MLPIKGPTDNNDNPVPCKSPADEEANPPEAAKPSPSSPAFLKALEAVVAAGRQGLLGPEAKEVAAGIPKVQGVGALNPIPLLSNTRKREKAASTRAAVRTVVQPAGAESLQSAPKEVWICGNSVILASRKRAKNYHGFQLGIPASRAYVYWHGIQAMKWEQLIPCLHEIYQFRSPPSVIIIHLGEDDLLPEDNTLLMMSMKNDLIILRRAFPNAVIVWSSLLPRCCSKKGQEPELMEKARNQVNRKMIDLCNEIGVHFLSHILITSDKTGLFLETGLSEAGACMFITDVMKVLRLYQILG